MDDLHNPANSTQDGLADRLLEFDAALAAGNTRTPLNADELPTEIRESFSCLDTQERQRLSEADSKALVPQTRNDSPNLSLFLDLSSDGRGSRSRDEISFPAQLGRFQLQKILGQGGCGIVFLAHDPALQRPVALKIPRPEALLTPELRQRFIREGRAAASLDHPNLMAVFEAGEIGGVCYLASAYCPGITLREWLLRHGGPVMPHAAARLIATLAEAMHYAHQQGICHRDLKPSNILLKDETASGQAIAALQSVTPKVLDFGLAKVSREVGSEHATRTGAVFGTPAYMAPEQAQGRSQDIGPAIDVHALGVILYELLTGHLPYAGDTDVEILNRVISDEASSPRRLCPCVPRDLETICLKCLEKQPLNRYRSMRELGEDLERFVEGRPIQARRIGWTARGAKWLRRRPRTAAAGAMAGVMSFSLLAALIWFGSRESAYSADLNRVRQALDLQKNRAQEQDWLERNQEYAVQIRSAALLKNGDEWDKMRDLLLAQKPRPHQRDVRGFEWQYLWAAGQGLLLPGNTANVSALAYSKNADLCAAGSLDGAIHLFDRDTGKLTAKLQGHTYEVRTLHFLKGDTQLLSTAFDKTPDGTGFRGEFILWSLRNENKFLRRGSYSHRWTNLGGPIFAVAPAAGVLFIIDRGNNYHRLLMLDLSDGTERELLRNDNLFLATAVPDASQVAVIYSQTTASNAVSCVELLEPSTKRRLAMNRLEKFVHLAGYSPDGKTLALGLGMDNLPNVVELLEVPSLRSRKAIEFSLLPGHLQYDWPGNRLAVTTQDRVHFFDVPSGSSLGSYKNLGCHPVAFSPEGEEVALGCRDGRIRTGNHFFVPQDSSLPGPLPKSEAWCAAFSLTGSALAAGYDHENGSEHETLRLWDLKTKKWRSLAGHDATVMALAVSPDGKTLATASYDQNVRLWDMAEGKCLHELKGHTDAVRTLAFSPDGRRLASAGSDLSIKIWNVEDGSLQGSWRGHDQMIRSLAFSPDGNILISGSNDRSIRIWNARDFLLVQAIANESKVQSVACSPDGSLIACGNENNKVELWQLSTGALWKSLPGHIGRVRSVAFSPDGKTLASGGEDKMVRLWSVVTGQELLTFPTEHFVNAVAFDSHKQLLAAALHNGAIMIWSGE